MDKLIDTFSSYGIKLDKLNLIELFSASAFFSSLLLIIALVGLRGFLIRYVRKDTEIIAKEQRRWIIRIKNAATSFMVIGLILIWAPQLHTFALSITAFAVALVVATKEMILCLTGAIMRATTQPFKVGEWVTIDGVTGEVVDLDIFAFTLQEVDMDGKSYQFTGRTITIPNSKLFTSNVVNANFFKAYIFEDVRVRVQFADIDPAPAFEKLKEIAESHFKKYRHDARAFNSKIRRRAGVDIGSAEPTFDLATTELGHYLFHVRFFLPTSIAADVGADVTREFLSHIHHTRHPAAQAAPVGEEAPESVA